MGRASRPYKKDRDGCVVLGRTPSGPAQHSHLDLQTLKPSLGPQIHPRAAAVCESMDDRGREIQ